MRKKILSFFTLLFISFIAISQCPKPYQLDIHTKTTNSITLTWNSGNSYLIGNFEIEYGLKNFVRGTGTKVYSSYIIKQINNLDPNTQYDFYVTNNCGNTPTTSDVYHGITDADYCNGDQFLDPGFENNYVGTYYESYSLSANSESQRVVLDFEVFELSDDATLKIWEDDYSFFRNPDAVYDKDNLPLEPIISKADDGSLYIEFESTNIQNNAIGWVGNVTCVDKPKCDMPKYISSSNITYDSVTLSWYKSTDNLTHIEYGPKGFLIGTGEIINTALNTITISNLNELTEYDFYLTEECDDLSLSDTNMTSVLTKTYCESTVSFHSIQAYELNQVKIGYVNFESSDEWQIEYGIKGFENNSGTIMTYSTEEAIISNLEGDTEYDFYLRNKCGDRFSTWTGPFLVKTNIDYCNLGKFYDRGGEEQDYTNDNIVGDQYIYLRENERVRFLVNSMQLDSSYYLYIYDGPNSNSPLLHSFNSWNRYSYMELVSSGESNVIFIDIQYNLFRNADSKWDIDIICEPAPNCEEVTDFSVVESKLKHNQCELNWTSTTNPNDTYIIEYGLEGFERGSGISVTTNDNFINLTDLNTSTLYQAYITTKCAEGGNNNIDVEPITFKTTPNYFGGDKFTDDGGIDNNIPENQTKVITIYPKVDEERVRVNFDHIDLITSNSYSCNLYIYSGTSTNSEQIVRLRKMIDLSYHGYSFASEDPSGALTFEFVYNSTDLNYFSSGWEADIISESLPDCSEPFNISKTRYTHEEINLAWESEDDVSEWKIEYGPTGFIRGTGLVKNTTDETVLITGLIPDTEYDFYVSSKCDNGSYNDYASVYKDSTRKDLSNGALITSDDLPINDVFPYVGQNITLYPNNINERIRFEFTYFNLDYSNEDTYYRSEVRVDFIEYTTERTTHDDYYTFLPNTNLFYPMVSEKEDGSLYIYQDIGGTSYWEAKVYSEPKPTCDITNEHRFLFQRVSNKEIELVWKKNDDNTTYKVEYGPVGFSLGSGITKEFDSDRQFLESELRRPYHTGNTNNNTFDENLIYYSMIFDQLEEDTEYEFYITTICPDGLSNTYPVPKLVKTTPNILNEGVYHTSSGGQMQQRQVWNILGKLENTTICPNSTEENIVATIKRLHIPAHYYYGDPFTVFNNNNTKDESKILFSSYTDINYYNNEVVVKADNENGCLTFNFSFPSSHIFGVFPETLEEYDDHYVNKGWFVEISSEPKSTLNLENIDYNLTDIQLYPNPSNDHFTLKGDLNSKIKEITINDIKGNSVKKYFNTNFNEKLYFNLPAGVYFVSIKTENKKNSVIKMMVK